MIRAERHTIRLAPGSVSNDVTESDALVAAAARAASADPARAAALFEEAVALYAGPLLPGLSDEADPAGTILVYEHSEPGT